MIRTGEQYRDSIRDGREIRVNGERVAGVTRYPAFKPIVDVRARIYDMAHDADTQAVMTYYALGFVVDMGAPGIKHLCRTGFAGRAPEQDYPLANRFDEVDTLVVFDDVPIPWENVLFYRHTRAASFIRSTLHRYSAFPCWPCDDL